MLITPLPVNKSINFNFNPDLRGLSPLQCMDQVVKYCGAVGLRVILDRHSSLADNGWKESLWFIPNDPYYTENQFIQDWQMLAQRYAGTTVIGADLWNDPKPPLSAWGWVGPNTRDWRIAAQTAGNAILAVNSQWLIFVEGLGTNGWPGSDLTYVQSNPVVLSMPSQLVYSVHELSQDAYNQTWFSSPIYPSNLRALWRSRWGYLAENAKSPIFVGCFGTFFVNAVKDDQWLTQLVNYMNGQFTSDGVSDLKAGQMGLSWSVGLQDIGILLNYDYKTVDTRTMSYLKTSFAPLLSGPVPSYTPTSTPSSRPTIVSTLKPSAKPSFTAKPSLKPTAPSMIPTSRPTNVLNGAQIFTYYSTVGNQIVDKDGKSIRIAAVNWFVTYNQ
mmetsp:Transcript_3837/g.5433  ORF Transcript_3837/g.5433 Transcript_3837/m.5433 type:complete len:385 (+) Transcript_3837:297-1451(+)